MLFISICNLGGYRTGAVVGSTVEEWMAAEASIVQLEPENRKKKKKL